MIHDFYLGAGSAILLLNAVQWSFSRDWIHGLFTFQPFLWLLLALAQGLPLTEPYFLAMHTGGDGLIVISYLELVYRLFGDQQSQHQFKRWVRPVQIGILTYALIEVGLLLIRPDQWLPSPIYPYGSLLYWSTLTASCAVGLGVAVRAGQAIGWFFAVGSFLLMLNEAQSVYYFFTRLFMNGPAALDGATMRVIMQLIIGGFILKLLCFALCLVFWQRKAAVARAVALARTEEQLVQERLEAELTQQRLEQEKAQVQLRALQAQVNPHFLFNSLNTLSGLIDDEPERAEEFLDELCKVYRYLLRANEHALTDLATELQFIRSYYHLLKTRYGDNLHLNIAVAAPYETYLLPSLTLQLLLENAVKHNVIDKNQPLQVDIATGPNGRLTVQNNLQKKTQQLPSTQVGLRNIVTKFRLLGQENVLVQETDDRFLVTIPLMRAGSITDHLQPAKPLD